jgi:hypothetical protein
MTTRLSLIILFVLTLLQAPLAGAAEDLAAQARDPTAPVTQFQTRLDYVGSFHNLPDADQTRLVLQPVIPFKIGEQPHLARITVPFVLKAPDWGALGMDEARDQTGTALPSDYVPTEDRDGLADTSVFDFLMFDSPWWPGRLALGLSAILPTATDPALGSEKWSLGPAGGGVAVYGDLTIGAIALFNFSVAGKSDRDDVQTMTIQPIISYGLGDGWSIELSEISYNYDFKGNKWTSAPLGGRIAKMLMIGKQPVRLYADLEHNFVDDIVAPEWTFRFAVVPLIQ